MAESLFARDFGQKVDLCSRIREILRNYPEGSSVWKESEWPQPLQTRSTCSSTLAPLRLAVIQNADDARARECVLLLDLRTHGAGSLFDARLAEFQGAS